MPKLLKDWVAEGIRTPDLLVFNQALKETDTNVVMPVDFVRLIWVAIIGYLVFGEIPDLFTWIGGAMIFSSALYIAYRETVRRRSAAP